MSVHALEKLGRYEVRAELGSGTFGNVYHAFDPKLRREVAIKVLKRAFLSDPEVLKRFDREACAAAKLHHPHIITVHDAEQVDGNWFIVSSYISGQPLNKLIPQEGMPAERAVRLTIQLADALHFAHSHNILHRDVKPANALVDERDHLYLMDFGMASWLEHEGTRLTHTGAILGTPAYMSPEQANGEVHQIDSQSDLFGAGAVLYHLLTGHIPFEGTNPALVIYNLVHSPLTRPSAHRPDLDPALESICVKALSKAKAERFASGQEFAQALRDWLAVARPISPVAIEPECDSPRPAEASLVDTHRLGAASQDTNVGGRKLALAIAMPRRQRGWVLALPTVLVLVGGVAGALVIFKPFAPEGDAVARQAGRDEQRQREQLAEQKQEEDGQVKARAIDEQNRRVRADFAEYQKVMPSEDATVSFLKESVSRRLQDWQVASKRGLAEAQLLLGHCYDEGIGVSKDTQEAVRLYRLAADQTLALAQYRLGDSYYFGTGVREDLKESARLYRLAAEQNLAAAQFRLGYFYLKGLSVSKNEREAVKWIRRAADQNHALAQLHLGRCYMHGTGVAKDEPEAVRWYRLAADQNNGVAQYYLGHCFEQGIGVTKDEKEALKWYRRAADQDAADAKEAVERLEKK